MANSLISNDIVAVTNFGSYDGQSILNVFHYIYSGDYVDAANYAAEMNKFNDSFKATVIDAAWKARVVNTFTFDFTRIQKVGPQPTDRGYYLQKNIGLAGDLPDLGCPADVQMCVSLSTDRAFRGATGGKHFTALPAASMAASYWNLLTRLSWATVGAQMQTNLVGTIPTRLLVPVVWSPRKPLAHGRILSTRVRGEVRTQHSRTVGRGI